MERQIWVDFNAVDDRGHVETLVRFAADGTDLDVGARLLAGDDEGNLCEAEVLEVDEGGLVRLALNLGTMTSDPPAEHLAGHGARVQH